MIYILNELSQRMVHTKLEAHEIMKTFILAANDAETKLDLKELRIDETIGRNLYELQLMDHYSIGQWSNDGQVSKDLKDKFKLITSSSPLISQNEVDRFENEICTYNGKEGKGIKAALFYNTFCINFLADEYKGKTALAIKHEFVLNDELQNEDKSIKCFATSYHVETHKEWFFDYQKQCIQASKDLWDKRLTLFPNLFFCDKVESQIRKNGISSDITNIIERLKELDFVASIWIRGSFSHEEINHHYNLTIHPESNLTLDNYKQSRTFKLPDGHSEVFELHIIVGSLRIHFYPDNNTHKIYIGYIGHHLKTWKF